MTTRSTVPVGPFVSLSWCRIERAMTCASWTCDGCGGGCLDRRAVDDAAGFIRCSSHHHQVFAPASMRGEVTLRLLRKSLLEPLSHVSRSHRALIMMHTAWRNAARRCSSARWRPVPATLRLNRGIPAVATRSMAGATTSSQAFQSTVRSAAGLPTRDEVMARLRSGEKFDLLVVGGGSTGAGAALDAAARGLKVRRHCKPRLATRAAHAAPLLVVARAFRCW